MRWKATSQNHPLTVAENISYGLRQRRPKPSKAQIVAAVERALETMRLPGFGPRRIWEMSGGQQQRVALARAIVNEPKVLFLDEPMAALDKKLRHDMQIELQTLQRQLGITFVMVTHDQEEALSMSDRICIMRDGEIAQVGSPRDLYDRPASRYVADFVGKSNFFDGRIERLDGSTAKLVGPGGTIFVDHANEGLGSDHENVIRPSTGGIVSLVRSLSGRIVQAGGLKRLSAHL